MPLLPSDYNNGIITIDNILNDINEDKTIKDKDKISDEFKDEINK
jgi:hypothetical protein